MSTAEASPVTAAEAKELFSDLDRLPALLLAVSGGPDSTALMLLMVRWWRTLQIKPKLFAVTVDHGLRAESKREAAEVARLARKLGVAHATLRWTGKKPAAGLQEAARATRYGLLAAAARKLKATHVVTAHTRDDQAETVLIRMSRGSGLVGLAAMTRISPLPGDGQRGIMLVRPLLDVPKLRLVATLRAAKIPFADDPSNRDPRFTRARLRGLMGELAREGLDARRLSLLARRARRADQAIEAVVDHAEAALTSLSPKRPSMSMDAAAYSGLPAEIGLRLLGRALTRLGNEGPVELAKLEALKAALDAAQIAGIQPYRRSLAGAIVTLKGPRITVERAPPRRGRTLTTRPAGNVRPTKSR